MTVHTILAPNRKGARCTGVHASDSAPRQSGGRSGAPEWRLPRGAASLGGVFLPRGKLGGPKNLQVALGPPTHRAHVRQRDTVQRHAERLSRACVDLGLGHLTVTIRSARCGVEPVGDAGVGVDAAEETATIGQRRNDQVESSHWQGSKARRPCPANSHCPSNWQASP